MARHGQIVSYGRDVRQAAEWVVANGKKMSAGHDVKTVSRYCERCNDVITMRVRTDAPCCPRCGSAW